MPIQNRFSEMQAEVTAWRRDLHEHPELLFDTHRTAGIVADKLRAFGCDEVATGIGRTGVVGIIHGRQNTSGRTIGLRADMDALPINETTGLPHASKTPGMMHACGHDGHTAMLLGAAKYLAETRNFNGSVAVIFQPAEEGGGGGREMVEDGMMDRFNITEVYGMHNKPGAPVGDFSIRPGPLLAAVDILTVDIEGLGGHAARAFAAVDTTLIAAHIILALQNIAARTTDPLDQVVVSMTSLQTESATHNVIPQKAQLLGTVRTLRPETRDRVEAEFRRVIAATAAAYGGKVSIDYNRSYPVTVNTEPQTAFATEIAREVVGDARVEADILPIMGGEDFSFMLEARPGAMIFAGNGDTANVHHPDYDFNDELIPYGCSFWATLVAKALPVT